MEALQREATRSRAFSALVEASLARLQGMAATLTSPPPSPDLSAIRSPAHLALAESLSE